MSEKTEQKRQLILESARQVFVDRGYKAVTMKDIVEASGISRGGLYLYFSSVEEVFLAVVEMEDTRVDVEITGEQLAGVTDAELLVFFLKTQKKEILRKKGSLMVAKYEYAFEHSKDKEKTEFLRKEVDKEIYVLRQILERGTKEGDFYCDRPRDMAREMVYVIEGLKIIACTIGIGERRVDRAFMKMVEELTELRYS